MRCLLALVLCASPGNAFIVPSAGRAAAIVNPRGSASLILPNGKGYGNKNFDPEAVSEEAKKKTVGRTAVVWVGIGSVVGLVLSSGKTFDRNNAPGMSEITEKKAARQKQLLDEAKAARAAAQR